MRKYLHVVLFATFPILFLYLHNIDLVQPFVVVRPLIFVWIGAVGIFFLIRLVVIKTDKTAILTSIFFLLFFSYGHIAYIPINLFTIINKPADTLIIFALLFVFTFILIVLKQGSFKNENYIFNAVSFFLVVTTTIRIGIYELGYNKTFSNEVSNIVLSAQKEVSRDNSSLPDIYYIILDGHARSDILKEMYGLDNSWFVEGLRERGFFVAEKSTSNYPQTYQTISSTFNLDYVQFLVNEIDENSNDRSAYGELIVNSEIFNFLKEKKYQLIFFDSGWSGTDSISNVERGKIPLGEFENVIIETTPISYFLGKHVQYRLHRNRTLGIFGELPGIANNNQHTFTYAHILTPHPPFVFDKDGSEVENDIHFSLADSSWKTIGNRTTEEYRRFYSNQLEYVDKMMLETIDEILAKSKDVVIILQSDHGPGSALTWNFPTEEGLRERFSNLFALYCQDSCKGELYDSITSVNTFRVIFNSYFGEDYKLLEDKNYFASWDYPYKFIDVTDIVGQGNW